MLRALLMRKGSVRWKRRTRHRAMRAALVFNDWDALEEELNKLRDKGKRIAFTNGCFDILHPGHMGLLEEARRSADALVVGLNTDESIRALKGSGRPLMDESARSRVLSAIRWVDFVVFFPQADPLLLIKRIRPDVLIKGSDYGPGEVVGELEMKSWGGKTIRARLMPGCSSTSLVQRLEGEQGDGG